LAVQQDVLVVGAGPAGSYAAMALARLGHRVLVFERQPEVGDAVCCTGIVSRESFDRFPETNDAVIAEISSARLLSPSGKELVLSSEVPQAYIVDRARFDQALAARAKREGAEYLLSARVADISPRDGCVEMAVEHGGVTTAFTGRVAVVGSGFGGRLSRKLGLGQPGDSVLGAQAHAEIQGVCETECYFSQSVAPGFFAWVVPTSPGRGLVGLLTRRRPGLYLERFLSKLAAEGKVASWDAAFKYGGIPLVPLRRACTQRVVVIGDAAGHCKPTTGGGIYYGLLGAQAAVRVVNEALRADDLSGRCLSGYDRAWRALLAKELQLGYIARRMYENLSDKQIDQIFAVVERSGIHHELLRSPESSFDWHAGSLLKAVRGAMRPKQSR
jgi:digeranylgeranylglycerophospholipid reductase